MLVVGFSLFLARSFILYKFESLAVFFYGMLLALLIVCTAALSSRWQPTLRQLRHLEITLFVLIVILFMAAQYVLMLRAVRDNDPARLARAVKISTLWMVAFMFTYAIFIPNPWRRAARLIVPMALAPMTVPWVLGAIHPELYHVAIKTASLENMSEDGLFLVLGAFTAIFGTHTINTLRIEAYRARLLNQYRLGRKLGGGGMGEVYLAEHQLLKRPCAIKLIRHDLIGNQRIFARFEREVRATAQLSHWNTIEIFDYGRNDNGAFFYVMEYLPGLSLAELVERFGPMPAARVIYLLRQACDALHEAHEAGLVHRDIKPANLMAAYRGGLHDVAKILDFGLVKTLSRARDGPSSFARRHRRRIAALHGTGTDHAKPRARSPHRHLRPGRRRLLHLDRQAPVQRRQPDGGHDRACPRLGHSAIADPERRSRRSRTHRSPLSGQGPGGSLSGYTEPRR